MELAIRLAFSETLEEAYCAVYNVRGNSWRGRTSRAWTISRIPRVAAFRAHVRSLIEATPVERIPRLKEELLSAYSGRGRMEVPEVAFVPEVREEMSGRVKRRRRSGREVVDVEEMLMRGAMSGGVKVKE